MQHDVMQHDNRTVQGIEEQYAWMKTMRDSHPVWLDEQRNCWHLFRYDDVYKNIADFQLLSSQGRPEVFVESREAAMAGHDGATARGFGRSLIGMDPPQHNKYRNLVSPLFTPQALERMSDHITTIAQELLDYVRPQGQCNFVNDIAYPLPTMVIIDMLGVPFSDRMLFRKWANGLLARQLCDAEFVQSSDDQRDNSQAEQFQGYLQEMSNYFEDMLADRRRQPRNDMMSQLVAAEVDGEHLSVDDLVSFCILLFFAGHVTTTNMLGHAIRCFDAHPDTFEQIRKQPELIPGAIEEVLRYASPVKRLFRKTAVDATIRGVTIPKNSFVFAWLESANRDERQFSEPERFIITREPNRHVAFGHGIHFCLGALLSRMEASIALPMIIKQLPDLQVVHDEPLEFYESGLLFGLKQLPITFTASQP
ncbi:MAG TPA: cytochrome P450 [Ktedonobacteraceae bacterium]